MKIGYDPEAAVHCKVCLAAEAEVVLLPCAHAGFCWGCSQQLDQCPLCRCGVELRKRIYL